MGTFADPLPLTYENQQLSPQQSNRSSRNVHAVESAGRDAPQVLAAVKLKGVQIEGAHGLRLVVLDIRVVDTVGTSGAPLSRTVYAQAPKHCRRWWLVC